MWTMKAWESDPKIIIIIIKVLKDKENWKKKGRDPGNLHLGREEKIWENDVLEKREVQEA